MTIVCLLCCCATEHGEPAAPWRWRCRRCEEVWRSKQWKEACRCRWWNKAWRRKRWKEMCRCRQWKEAWKRGRCRREVQKKDVWRWTTVLCFAFTVFFEGLILLNVCTAHASCHHNAWPPRERASSRLPSGASAAALGRVNGRTVYTAAGSMRRRVSSLQVGERVAKRDRADE